jgi:hypothetical protein
MLTGERGERIKSFFGGLGGVEDAEIVSMAASVGDVVSLRLNFDFDLEAPSPVFTDGDSNDEEEDVSNSNDFKIVCGRDLDLECWGVTVNCFVVDDEEDVIVAPRTGDDCVEDMGEEDGEFEPGDDGDDDDDDPILRNLLPRNEAGDDGRRT